MSDVDETPVPTGRRNAHLRKTVGDIIRSMAVVLVVVFALVLLAWRPMPEEIRVVSVDPAVAAAVTDASFPVMAPTGLPEQWRPTSARWEPSAESGSELVLHVGYVTPSDQYAQFSQSAAASERYLSEQTSGGAPTGTRVVDAVTWQEWVADDRISLVQIEDGVTTIVSGTGEWSELETLARSLNPA